MFSKNCEFKMLKKEIRRTKDIPDEYKEHMLKSLIDDDVTNFLLHDGKKYKFLLANSIFYRAYDIYTSSIISFTLRNRVSLYILLRSQFENMCRIAFYIKNPDKIKDAFNFEKEKEEKNIRISDWRKCLKELYDEDGFPGEYGTDFVNNTYKYYSDITHPFTEGLKLYYGGMAVMTLDEHHKYPYFKTTLCQLSHHTSYSTDEKEYFSMMISIFFSEVIRLLQIIVKLEVDDEIKDYSELHKNPNKYNEKF